MSQVITKYVRRFREYDFKLSYVHDYVTLKTNQIKWNSKSCENKNMLCSYSSSRAR